MPDVQHSALAGAEIHEPKGIAGASANETYVADGLGAGAWSEPEPKGLVGEDAGKVYVSDGADSGAWSPREYHLTVELADVSTASTVYLPIPYAGDVVKITSVLTGVIATADANILLKDNAGNTMGGMVIAFSGSAAGDVDFDDTLANNDVTDNDFITIETDGASTNTVPVVFTVTIQRTS